MNILHYDLISQFKKAFYKNLLSPEHVISGEKRMNKFSYPDGGEDEEVNFWGYILEKEGSKYLLPSKDKNDKFINLNTILPVLATNTTRVSYQGQVYHLIEKPITAKFKTLKQYSFRILVDKFSSLKHSNPTHHKLLWFIGLSQMMDRANARISTPPGFGKDSVVDILGNLIGKSATIVSPTLAKLEFMTSFKWLAVNEVVDITKTNWRPIEQFLLDAGAFKPEIAKHSRAVSSGVKEMLDISEFSLSLLYNDIDNYTKKTDYFDFIAKDAVKDRFPAFRLFGTFEEDFNEIKNINVEQYVKNHWNEYKDLIYTFTYFKKHLFKELHHYTTKAFDDYPERWKTNIGKVLRIIDLYCESQSEFDSWVGNLKASMSDYTEMLDYPDWLESAKGRLGNKKFSDVLPEVSKLNTFSGKNSLLREVELPKRMEDKNDFWK